jgi:hypothetical protein
MQTYRFHYSTDEEVDGYDRFFPRKDIDHGCFFPDGIQWKHVLLEFCTFLESTGYHGVVERVENGLGLDEDERNAASSNS